MKCSLNEVLSRYTTDSLIVSHSEQRSMHVKNIFSRFRKRIYALFPRESKVVALVAHSSLISIDFLDNVELVHILNMYELFAAVS